MKSGFWRLLTSVGKYKRLVFGNIFSNIMVSIFTVVSIPAIKPFLDILFDQVEPVQSNTAPALNMNNALVWLQYQFSHLIETYGKQQSLAYVCILIVILFFLKNFFRYASLFFMTPLRNNMIRDMRQDLYDKVLSMSVSYFSKQKKGDLISRFSSDVVEVENSILNMLEVLVKSPLTIFGCVIFMFYISVKLTIFVFVLILFTAVIIGGLSRQLKKSSGKAQDQLGVLTTLLDETISGIKIIKSFNASDFLSRRMDRANNRYKNLLNRIIWRRELSSPLSEFLGVSVVALLLWFGSSLVFEGEMAAGTFFAYIFAFFNVIEPAKSFSKAYYNIQKGSAALDRIHQVMDAPQIEINHGDNHVSGILNEIRFEQVDFAYEDDHPVLRHIDIEIPVGNTIALVGASGAGKSTLIDLLCRFYDPDAGVITIDGVDIKEIRLDDLRSLMAVVTQDSVVFHDTIFNNISFGKKEAQIDDIVQAAKIANAHDFIMETEAGYNSIIGDRGMKLSGGQRQRLTLARALLKDSPLLILDEATSALDSESERLIQQALQKIAKQKTLIIIAHRLSTVQHADQIYVIKEGRIVENGKHQELITKSGEYKKFVELQAF